MNTLHYYYTSPRYTSLRFASRFTKLHHAKLRFGNAREYTHQLHQLSMFQGSEPWLRAAPSSSCAASCASGSGSQYTSTCLGTPGQDCRLRLLLLRYSLKLTCTRSCIDLDRISPLVRSLCNSSVLKFQVFSLRFI